MRQEYLSYIAPASPTTCGVVPRASRKNRLPREALPTIVPEDDGSGIRTRPLKEGLRIAPQEDKISAVRRRAPDFAANRCLERLRSEA